MTTKDCCDRRVEIRCCCRHSYHATKKVGFKKSERFLECLKKYYVVCLAPLNWWYWYMMQINGGRFVLVKVHVAAIQKTLPPLSIRDCTSCNLICKPMNALDSVCSLSMKFTAFVLFDHTNVLKQMPALFFIFVFFSSSFYKCFFPQHSQ